MRLKRSRAGRYLKRQRDRIAVALRRSRVRPPVVESVREWAQARPEIECELLRPVEVTSRRAPRTIEASVDERFFEIAGAEYTVPERYLARIPRGRLVGDAGLVVLPDGAFASEVTFTREHLVQQPAYSLRLPRRVHRKDGNYFSLLSLWAHRYNYYHWIHDAMLRLHLILPQLPRDIRFVVPPSPRSFQLESLGFLGISTDQLCGFSGRELWELETLYFAPPAARSGSNSPAAIEWFREAAWSHLGLTPGAGKRRIYISRRRTRYRRIVNEPEVERVLHDFGFETYLFEDLSFPEQVTLMSQAEAVASSSGAALTNLLFAPPGTKVLVMVEPVQISWFFWSLSEAAGHEYWYALGETVPHLSPPHDADLRVPPEKVGRTLATMFGVGG
jgi:Glycosyltransferase 61